MAYQASDEGVRIAEESGDIFSKAMAYSNHGTACYGKGLFERAREHLLKAVDFCDKINFYAKDAQTQNFLGDLCFEMREYKKSKEHYEKSLWLIENNRLLSSWKNFVNLGIAFHTKLMTARRNF